MSYFVALIFILCFADPANADGRKEIEYQRTLCGGMLINRHLPNGTEVDCISTTHAIEVDFSRHRAEAIGQSLQYASALEKLPGIILICETGETGTTCLKHRYLVEQTVSYWHIGMTIWLCDADAVGLDDCRREEICNSNPGSICDSRPHASP